MVDYNLDYGKSNPIAEFQAGYEGAQRIRAGNQKIRTNDIENDDNQLALAQKKLAATHDLLKGVTPENYAQRLQIGINSGIISPADIESGKIPREYDQGTIDAWSGMLINSKDAIDNAYKRAQIQQMTSGGSTGVLMDRLKNEPELRDTYFNKVNAGKGVVADEYGNPIIKPGYNQAVASTEGAKKSAEQDEILRTAADIEQQKEAGRLRGAPLPTPIIDKQDELIDEASTGKGLVADTDAFIKRLNTGALKLGALSNIENRMKNGLSVSTEESQQLADFDAFVERLRNDTLRLQKGVQTEGDAVRALNEIMTNRRDPGVVKKRLETLNALNQRAVDNRISRIKTLRNEYGKGDLPEQPPVESPYAPKETFNRSVESTDPYQKAREAIAAGKSRAAVEKRLLDNGLDPRRLNQ